MKNGRRMILACHTRKVRLPYGRAWFALTGPAFLALRLPPQAMPDSNPGGNPIR
jgi:hypothetical protein